MDKPPASVVSPTRVIEYACVDSSVKYLGNNTLYVDGKLLGPVPCLAICHDPETKEFLVVHCGADWDVQGIAGGYTTPEKAKEAAERMYQGISAKWSETNYTEEDVEKFLEEAYSESRCSFCGKRSDQVRTMFRSVTAGICGECITTFYQSLVKEQNA
jgi:hypothetical protein